MEKLVNYLIDEYGEEGANRLHKVPMIVSLAMRNQLPENWKSMVDKVALFNGVKKVDKS